MRLFVRGQRKKLDEGWRITGKKNVQVKREETESGGKEGIEIEKGREGRKREVNDCFGFAFIAISELSIQFQKRNQILKSGVRSQGSRF